METLPVPAMVTAVLLVVAFGAMDTAIPLVDPDEMETRLVVPVGARDTLPAGVTDTPPDPAMLTAVFVFVVGAITILLGVTDTVPVGLSVVDMPSTVHAPTGLILTELLVLPPK